MKFNREDLQDMVYGGRKLQKVYEEITDHDRWAIVFLVVFQYEDKFYRSYYRKGATEMQDEEPYEYDSREIECPEVRKKEIVIEKWVEI